MKTTDSLNEPELNIEGVSEQDLKRNPFKAPKGYFDNLTPRVMENVRNSEVSIESAWPAWLKMLTPTVVVAAVALAIWFFSPPTNTETLDFETVLASFSVEEVVTYADADPNELIQYELVDYSELALGDVTEEELLNYLELEEEIEINTWMNEIEI